MELFITISIIMMIYGFVSKSFAYFILLLAVLSSMFLIKDSRTQNSSATLTFKDEELDRIEKLVDTLK